jgi:hypothetical protein
MAPTLTAPIGNDISLVLEKQSRYAIQSMIMGHLSYGMYLQKMSRKALLAHESLLVENPTTDEPFCVQLVLAST